MVVSDGDEGTCYYRPLTERQVRVETVAAVMEMIDRGFPGENDAELGMHCNGYGLWFIRPGQTGTAPLTEHEIADMIEARTDA
jgi:hypothetical protein